MAAQNLPSMAVEQIPSLPVDQIPSIENPNPSGAITIPLYDTPVAPQQPQQQIPIEPQVQQTQAPQQPEVNPELEKLKAEIANLQSKVVTSGQSNNPQMDELLGLLKKQYEQPSTPQVNYLEMSDADLLLEMLGDPENGVKPKAKEILQTVTEQVRNEHSQTVNFITTQLNDIAAKQMLHDLHYNHYQDEHYEDIKKEIGQLLTTKEGAIVLAREGQAGLESLYSYFKSQKLAQQPNEIVTKWDDPAALKQRYEELQNRQQPPTKTQQVAQLQSAGQVAPQPTLVAYSGGKTNDDVNLELIQNNRMKYSF